MAFNATLSVAGLEVPVFEFEVGLKQAFNDQGQPSSGVFLGDFFLIVEGGDDTFYEWLCELGRLESGKLTVQRPAAESPFLVYEFENAFLTDLNESFYYIDNMNNQFNSVSSSEDNSEGELKNLLRLRGKDSNYAPLENAYMATSNFQRRTNNAFCLFFSISCEKIKVRDVEHDNQWGL